MTDTVAALNGALAGRYLVEKELGQGGMATVYLARDLKHDRKVAIKVLHAHLVAAMGIERFLKEIRTTAHLQHPHILPLHDSGDADGRLFYVMPYVDGESLRQRLDREGYLPVAEAVRIVREVVAALDYAHRHHVIHRDVKPGNVLLHDGTAMLADFGIALAPEPGDPRLTETGMSLGTPQYMSPEQALCDRRIDARCDIYATGAMLYEMLTGEAPFTGPTAQAVVAKVLTVSAIPPSRQRKGISREVDNVVLTALAKNPADRFATAAAMEAALAATATLPVPRGRRVRYASWAAAGAFLVLAALATRPWHGRRAAESGYVPDSAAKRLVGEAAELANLRQPGQCKLAIERYAEATERDSGYAVAWGGLAKAHALCGLFGAPDQDPAVEFANAKTAIGRALQLDPRSWNAYTARGMVNVFRDHDFAAAEHDLTKAIELDSTQYEPWLFLVPYYLAANEIDSAERALRHAKELAPAGAPVIRLRLANVLQYNNKVAEAEREVEQVLESDPTSELARIELLEIMLSTGRCDRPPTGLPDDTLSTMQFNRATLAYYWAACGQRQRAERYADSMSRLGPSAYVDRLALAVVYAGLHDTSMEMTSLDQAVKQHNWAIFMLRWHFAFADVRDRPEFQSLMAEANLK